MIVRIVTYERSTLVNDEKYIGLDVHQATIVVAVMDSTGKLVMESILATEAATILQFFAGLRGTLSVTFEEGTWRLGCTICSSLTLTNWWCAIPGRMRCSKTGTRVIGSMPASWRSCYAAINSNRSTMARRACGCCGSCREVI